MANIFELNNVVVNNFKSIRLWFLIPPFLVLISFCLYFTLSKETNFVDEYVACQKDVFFFLNNKLVQFPNLQFNLTQLGDVIIGFALLTVFLIYAPKLWEALLLSAIISLIVSTTLKQIFAIPRPPKMYNHDSFVIIGRAIAAPTSLPSGHSITTFIVITIVLFAFMPKRNVYKILWYTFMFLLGLIIAFSRVGVGAHYPLDVIIGGILGFIVAIIGIKISERLNLFGWVKNKRLCLILVLTIWGIFIITKMIKINLPIFYLSLMSLVLTVFITIKTYVKKN
ncbi:hypothetical protein IMCC3317_15050 [Kordia antarctica]|uniref:Phosphatidic acid phosphatase type 2/haloperoxidase domain-containing protein n=1 Tax=Kordia antarctica TaxID=1218801 RepID=A0A7L4ZIY3_9FLAO|nr:phosphatase PAP2 family protein [Kordia antarctica]QHI36146.1 hypothetical protein IMCC3317_15050 [Kordia antarctica]